MAQKNDSRRALVGAAFASCVITSLPLLAETLHNAGRIWPDLQAMLFEIVPGMLAAAFGASRLRENPFVRKRMPSVLLLLAIAFVTFVECMVALTALAAHGMEGGIIIVAGAAVMAFVVAVQAGLGVLAWFLLSRLAKQLDRDAATSFHPNERSAKWLAVAALVHIAIKGATGGPVIFGLFAAAVAVSLALASKETLAMTLSGIALTLGVAAPIADRVYYAHREKLESLPLCEGDDDAVVALGTLDADREMGALAHRASALPGVAEAYAFSRSPYGDQELSLVVLPVGGGALDPVLRKELETDVVTPNCVIDNEGTVPKVTVEDPKYVEIPVQAHIHLAPNASADTAKADVARALHDAFDPHPGAKLIHDQSARGIDIAQSASVTSVRYKSGNEFFDTRIEELKLGEVPTLGKVDITIESGDE